MEEVWVMLSLQVKEKNNHPIIPSEDAADIIG